MQVTFVRFQAADGVELQGWLSGQGGDVAAVHIHGMCGNGYENYFLDDLRRMYNQLGIAFLAIDTRGRGIISDFRQADGWKHAGSCFEIFEESLHDIKGALDYLRSLGASKFILEGHSLGCSKIVNYIVAEQPHDVQKIILLAPTDMIAWANADPLHKQQLAKAKQLVAAGKGEELIGAQCWPLDKTPLSAQAYLSKSDAGAPVDIYGVRANGKALLGTVAQPVLIVYGTDDIGVMHPFGSMDVFRERLDQIKHPNTELAIIQDASHGFSGFEDELSRAVQAYIGATNA
ncbi:MAG TPA: alpha/beta fold hydrolase [Candidatus Saccharimonadales bacterium]|nr:alpha/beta fold hydrolase [Candidatus Saccharimonadales bacterium]